MDRYTIDGQVTPVIIGVREISPSNLPSQSWVNLHLQYTHGEGAVVALANQAQSNGNPVYGIKDVPPTSSTGLPNITQPDIYFASGDTGYVVANTKQPEIDYQAPDGTNVESHYSGTGGVQLSTFLNRAAFALRLGDFNLLISDQITDKSRIMFVRDPVQMAQKAAPVPQLQPEPLRGGGQRPDLLDRRRLHDDQPVPLLPERRHPAGGAGQRSPVQLQLRPQLGEGGHQRLLGQDDLLHADPNDPILRAYEAAFPNMFTPSPR